MHLVLAVVHAALLAAARVLCYLSTTRKLRSLSPPRSVAAGQLGETPFIDRPPASHLNSAVWHAAGFSSYVCRARASKMYAMKRRTDIHGADKHTDKHTDSVSPRIQAREEVRQPVSPGSYADLATVLTHYITNQTLLPQVSIISNKQWQGFLDLATQLFHVVSFCRAFTR